MEINEKKYCFQSDGTVVTGWVNIGNWVMYFNPVTGEAATGMTVIDGKQYYFDKKWSKDIRFSVYQRKTVLFWGEWRTSQKNMGDC